MNHRGHVCIFTSAHPLDDVRVSSKIASSFLDLGFRVSWVGPDLTFVKARADLDERLDYHLTTHGRGKIDRVTSARRVARKAAEVDDVDWYYCPDPDAALAATALARGSRSRVIFDIHELYHGARLERWLFGLPAGPLRELMRRRIVATCRRSDLVIGVSRSILSPYVSDRDTSVAVRNCAPRWFVDTPGVTGAGRRTEGVTFMHGKALPSNGTSVVLDAMAAAGGSIDGAQAIVIRSSAGGDGYQEVVDRRLEDPALAGRVRLNRAVTHEEMPHLLAQCDVGIIAYGRGLGELSLPNRLFEYMAAGMAVLAPSYAVDIKEIVDEEGIGLTVDFERPEEVAEAMRWFHENRAATTAMGERARTSFVERHNWDAEFGRLVDAMEASS